MSLSGFLRSQLVSYQSCVAKKRILEAPDADDVKITGDDWPGSLGDPTGFYAQCFRYFHFKLPACLQSHREYFSKEGRGFGEAAFHAMWFLLFREFAPRAFLEIGVYRGQTLSLASLLQRELGCAGEVAGISPFEPVGDSVSRYRGNVEYLADTLANFAHFGLPKPMLLKAYSTDPAAVELIRSRRWDCIYIDGNHDYEIAKADWENCAAGVREGGVIVLDDSGLGTRYEPPPFATKGHPGPSRVAEEIDHSCFAEILQVGHNRVFQKIAAS